MSPPHGNILSNTSYTQDFLDKPFSRRELIIRPGIHISHQNITKFQQYLFATFCNFLKINLLNISKN